MKTRLSHVGLAAAGLAILVAGCSDPTAAPPPTFDDFAPEAPSFDMHEGDVSAANVVDLTYLDAQEEVANGVWVEQNVFDGSTGTGVFESFVRLNSNATSVKGFNTSGRPLNNDEMASANFTRDLLLSSVPLQPRTAEPDAAIYREFRADINQTAGGTFLSLDAIQVFISKTPGANPDLPLAPGSFGECSALVWEMPEDNWIALNYLLAPGSGNGDMRLLIPDELFTAAQAGCASAGPWYVYLYSEFGGEDGIWGQDNGFEEWSVRKAVGEATAFKTATGTFDRTWNWTLDKSVDVDTWDLFAGDDATSEYEVTVDASSTNSNYQVEGRAELINAGGTALRMGTRTDQIGYVDEFDLDGPMTVVATATLNCDDSVLRSQGSNLFLDPGNTLTCDYNYTFPGTPDAPPAGMVWANRVTFNTGTGQGVAYSYTTEFEFLVGDIFGNPITVEDNFDDEGFVDLFSRNAETETLPFSYTYTRNFACSADEGTFANTARIKGTSTTSSASVTVNCYELDIEKDAETSFRWDWSIDKTEDAARTELFLNYGELGTLNYTVTASATDVEHQVSGNITVTNDAPIDAVLNSITDVITPGDIAGAVSCLVGEEGAEEEAVFPYTLGAGDALSCTYSADLPNRDARLNTATAEQQNYSYAFDPTEGESGEVSSTESGTTDYDATADVEFGIGDDNCVEVFDDKTDTGNPVSLGFACAQADDDNPAGAVLLDANGDAEFTYSLTVGVDAGADIELECGTTTLTNIASLMDQTADWTVTVNVYCPDPDDETAWAANGDTPLELAYNPGGGGNWATYVQYSGAMKVTTMFAGQTIEVGTATFSAPVGGMVTIRVDLTGGWTFETDGIIAVQDYASAPSGNPAPGQFDHKKLASGTSVSITVPMNSFYGVHVVVMN